MRRSRVTARRARGSSKARRGLAESRAPFGNARPGAAAARLYDADFYSWTRAQARALRRLAGAGRPEADYANLAEEIDSLGKEQANALRSSYQVLLCHLLKWRYQPALRSTSWRNSIRRERRNIELRIEDNPGLKPRRAALFQRAYRLARADAADETDLPPASFPPDCPWSLKQATDEGFWPE
jgi:hypothetical protein